MLCSLEACCGETYETPLPRERKPTLCYVTSRPHSSARSCAFSRRSGFREDHDRSHARTAGNHSEGGSSRNHWIQTVKKDLGTLALGRTGAPRGRRYARERREDSGQRSSRCRARTALRVFIWARCRCRWKRCGMAARRVRVNFDRRVVPFVEARARPMSAGATTSSSGPFFATRQKQNSGAPQESSGSARCAARCAFPVLAIGGVTVENAHSCSPQVRRAWPAIRCSGIRRCIGRRKPSARAEKSPWSEDRATISRRVHVEPHANSRNGCGLHACGEVMRQGLRAFSGSGRGGRGLRRLRNIPAA